MNYLNKYKVNPNRLLSKQTNILLRHQRMPGDILTMTPLVRDLKKTYGDMVKIKVDTPQGQEIWKNNPYVTQVENFVPDERYDLDYKLAIENEARGLNMAEGFRQDFIQKSGLHIIPSDMWPDIFLSEEEVEDCKRRIIPSSIDMNHFWLICPGNKKSCQIKVWPKEFWEKITDECRLKDIKLIQIGQSKHRHKPIKDVINFIDKTENLRDLFSLFYFVRGSIGYHSLHMHIAAAFRKPCLVLAGGRESTSLFKYPNHIVYSTIGQVPCCQYGGCYKGKSKTVKELCGDKVIISLQNEIIPLCMMFISLDKVIADLKFYNKLIGDGIIKSYEYKLVKENNKIYNSGYDEPIYTTTCGWVDENGKIRELTAPFNQPSVKTFRMICNTNCWGGGERTAVNIIKIMQRRGYLCELVSASDNEVMDEFKHYLPEGVECRNQNDSCIGQPSITFFQVNDTLIRIKKGIIQKEPILKWFKSDRLIMGINYTAIDLQKWMQADLYICQSRALGEKVLKLFSDVSRRVVLLKPPSDIQPFLQVKYNRDWSCPILIRHSSQGNQKYYDNIQEQIDHIYSIRPETDIHLMPAPNFLQDKRVQKYPFNALDPWVFLESGNIFWYFVDENKFVESGCNVVLEAMASGIPVLCNDNGGLPDVVTKEVGWCCSTFEEMYSVIENMDMDEAKVKGINARKKVQNIVRPDLWEKYIIGER